MRSYALLGQLDSTKEKEFELIDKMIDHTELQKNLLPSQVIRYAAAWIRICEIEKARLSEGKRSFVPKQVAYELNGISTGSNSIPREIWEKLEEAASRR
jgi:hypothetical protein